MPTNRISVLVSLEGQDNQLRATLAKAEKGLADLATTAKTAGHKASEGLAQVKAGVGAFHEQFGRAKTQLIGFLAVFEFAGQVRQLIAVADAWNLMQARLKLATAGTREFSAAKAELFAIAQRVGVPIQEVTTLYGKLQQAVRQLGGEQRLAFDLTEAISQALRISGASATEAQSSLLQFGQALSSGVLRGEEFNSVVENSPRLAQALADGLNVPIGRLRKLAEQGQLTADVVVRALMSQKDKLASEYGQLPVTVSQAFVRLQNAFGLWVSKVDESTGFTQKLAGAMDLLARNLDTVMSWLNVIKNVGLAVLIYRFLPAFITAWQTAGAAAVTAAQLTSAAWATANTSLTAAIASAGALKVAFAVLAAAYAGWEIGTWLSERFEIVRKAGIFMVQVLMTGFENLRFQWELFAALFTSDTLAAATQRHQERLAQMQATFADMYQDAANQGSAATQAMDSAASAAEEINRRLQAVQQGTQEAVGRGVEAVHGALEKLNGRISQIEAAASKAQQVVSDAVSKMAASYQGLTGLIQSGLDAQLAAVQRSADAQKAALESSNASQALSIAKGTEILTTSLSQQTQLRQQATTQTLALIEQESHARLDAASREGASQAERRANVLRVENEILAARKATLQEALSAYITHINALNAEANRHLAEIKQIEEQKRLLHQSTSDRIRELQRSAMTEVQAYQDKQTQIQELQTQARAALQQGEFDKAKEFAKQAADLASQTAQAVKQGDQEVVTQKQAVQRAIEAIRTSEELTVKALDGEKAAHKAAADAAISARGGIEEALGKTQSQIEAITAQLKDGLKLSIDIDQDRLQKGLAELDKLLAERERLIPIKADLEQAQKQLTEFEQLLKEGKTLPVDADTSKAEAALQQLSQYAKENTQIELKVDSDKALTAVQNVQRSITLLGDLKTQSQHLVNSNVDEARRAIQSLQGQNTQSTHTIVVRRVEGNAAGGLVGDGVNASQAVTAFAQGGAVGSSGGGASFPSMGGGKVPGSGNEDTVPRTLEAGAFVLRKAAVRKYGDGLLSRLMTPVQRFASGGSVKLWQPPKASGKADGSGGLEGPRPVAGFTTPPLNRNVAELLKMIELGIQSRNEYAQYIASKYGSAVSLDYVRKTAQFGEQDAVRDRQRLETFQYRKQLTGNEQQVLDEMKQRWRTAMAQTLLIGKDAERELIDYMEENAGEFLARGGPSGKLARSDTVPAMLTPGEYVVRREVVSRLGVGLFESLNNLSLPKDRLRQRLGGAGGSSGRGSGSQDGPSVTGFARGGLVRAGQAASNLASKATSVLAQLIPDADLATAVARQLATAISGAASSASGISAPQMVVVAAQNTAASTSAGGPASAAPHRTIRVELSNGGQQVSASVDARDESRLLDLLKQARSRA